MEKPKYFITTPIYYPSGSWHIGHCYTTVICDAIANFKRMEGYDVFFLTGTDEHGQKIENHAAELHIQPKQLTDELVSNIKKLWETLGIHYDKFIRTTDKEHIETVQKIFTKLYEKGDIYKAEYEGWYCTPCESFWTETQLVDGKCPDCHREVKKAKEESYFFRLSKYQKQLEELFTTNNEFLQPNSRINEMLNNFIRPGLQDLAVTRTSVKWGIEVPFDKKHTIYVWIDALANYLSALGYLSDDDSLYRKYWPADLHMVGKEIVRFHSIIWPALLMALDLPLPKQIYGHGWLLLDGDKMSKSKGNVADPFMLCDRYGADVLRYYLLREIPFGKDGAYTPESYIKRMNSDLCNDLGNLVSRTTAMVAQYFNGVLPVSQEKADIDNELINTAISAYNKAKTAIDNLNAPDALTEIFKVIQRANKYIDETTPWILAKTEEGKKRLATVLYNLTESIRISALLLKPFIPDTAQKIYDKLNLGKIPEDFSTADKFGVIQPGTRIEKSEPLFMRCDVNKETEYLMNSCHSKAEENKKEDNKQDKKQSEKNESTASSEISIEDFMKVQLVTAKILQCEKIEKRDKLYKLTVELGNEKRTVVSGIAPYYTPDYLIGKTVVLVKNLKPCKLGGVMSEGMILCCDDDGKVIFVTPEKPAESGKTVR